MINETFERGSGDEILSVINQPINGVSNGIFKHFKLEINEESKAFKRSKNG